MLSVEILSDALLVSYVPFTLTSERCMSCRSSSVKYTANAGIVRRQTCSIETVTSSYQLAVLHDCQWMLIVYTDPSFTIENVLEVIQMWRPQDLNQAFAMEGNEIVPQSHLEEIKKMYGDNIEDCYHKCAEYYHENSPVASWSDLAFKMYQSSTQQQDLECLMKWLPPKGMFRQYQGVFSKFNYKTTCIN